MRQHALGQPAVIGARQRHFDLDLRVQPELEHRCRKHHGDVDADGIHPAARQRDVTVYAGLGLFHAAHRVAHDAAAHVLVADTGRKHADAFGIRLPRAARKLLQHRVIHIFENLADRFAFVVMRVDIHDREILVAAFGGLLGRMREQLAGVEFLDLHAAKIGREGPCPFVVRKADPRFRTMFDQFRRSRPGLPHAELEHLQVHRLEHRGDRHHHFGRGGGIGRKGGQGAVVFRGAFGVEPHGVRQHVLDFGIARARNCFSLRRHRCPPRA